MTEKSEETSGEEVDEDTISMNIMEKFYEIVESIVYMKTPFSKELCIFSIMTHAGSDIDKSIKISNEKIVIERVENNVRHISFFATENELKETEKVVTIKIPMRLVSFYGKRGRRGGVGPCRYRECRERCVDCQAAMNRCSSDFSCYGEGICFVEEPC